MVTYIDSLPKELRNELQYFRRYPLSIEVSTYIGIRLSYDRTSETEDHFVTLVTDRKNLVVPGNLRADVVLSSDSFNAYIKILPTHLMTPITLAELLNKMRIHAYLSETGFINCISYLNALLTKYEFVEQLVYYPTEHNATVLIHIIQK